ncbi:MAG: chemotaxis protein CheA [Maritimibacter sp.]
MSDPMAEIRASFFIECEELLESLQDGLQAMFDGDQDPETVNVVFRAVHSIKGGAGAFGLDTLVAFAHRFETAMDEVRGGRLEPDADNLKLFFHGADILTDLVRESRDGQEHNEEVYGPVLTELDSLVGATGEEEPEEEIDFQPATIALDLGLPGDDALAGDALLGDLPDLGALTGEAPAAAAAAPAEPEGDPTYTIHFRPEAALYASGNEPLFLIRALRDLGPLTTKCRDNDVPGISDLKPEGAYISWEMTLTTGEGEPAIREAFDFVEGICDLEISVEGGAPAPAQPAAAAAPLPGLDSLPSMEELGNLHDGGDDQPPMNEATPADNSAPVAAPQAPAPEAAAPTPAPEAPKPAPAPAEIVKSAPATAEKAPAKNVTAAPRATVRVDLDRIDRLVNLVGEIVINQAMLSQSVEAAGLPPNSSVRAGLEEFLQLTRDIQESVMMIRAQPVKSLFQRMARIVRESSSGVGKDVRLHTEGENTEVDKTVIERLADPLTHMIRNAVDHGLESNDDRVTAGKSREGHVHLRAMHRSGRVVIEVADDGAGINREKVLNKAIEKGLVAPEAQLSPGEIDNLLFLPGFSTADQVSNLSGRGVGMDVVKSAISALGGRVTITSEQGVGTTFSISLPLTLAVLDGMVVSVADETLVVPLNSIVETLALTTEDIRPFGPNTHVVNIRDKFVPLLDLGAELGYRNPLEDYSGGVVLLIGQEDGSTAAVVVDSIEDQRQVVIKGLQDSYGHVPGIAAATILGDGQIALILDPVDLITRASGHTRARSSSTEQLDQPSEEMGIPA